MDVLLRQFPFQVAFISLPLIIPTFFILATIRLSKSSKSSRQRIKLLEGDENLRENALVHAFSRFENELERAVVDAIEDAQGGHPGPARKASYSVATNGSQNAKAFDANGNGVPNPASSNDTKASLDATKSSEKSEKGSKKKSGQPILSSAQLTMASHLNAIPQVTKHLVFIDPIRNSHATIIARDVKNFEFHKRGWGVLRHWADGFVL